VLKPNPNGGDNASKWTEIEIPEPPKTGNCRYCKHHEWMHRFNERGIRPCQENSNYIAKATRSGSVSILIPQKASVGACPCMEYVPGDNLAYLEWKSKKENI
jgi:hypothetical protein